MFHFFGQFFILHEQLSIFFANNFRCEKFYLLSIFLTNNFLLQTIFERTIFCEQFSWHRKLLGSDTSIWIHIRTCLKKCCRIVLLKKAKCSFNLKIYIFIRLDYWWDYYQMSYNIGNTGISSPIFFVSFSLFFFFLVFSN